MHTFRQSTAARKEKKTHARSTNTKKIKIRRRGKTSANQRLLSYLCQLLPVRTKFATSGRSKIAMLLRLLPIIIMMVMQHTIRCDQCHKMKMKKILKKKRKTESKSAAIGRYCLELHNIYSNHCR